MNGLEFDPPVGFTAQVRIDGLSTNHEDLLVTLIPLVDRAGVWWSLGQVFDYEYSVWCDNITVLSRDYIPVRLFADLIVFTQQPDIENLLSEVRSSWQYQVDTANKGSMSTPSTKALVVSTQDTVVRER